MNQPVNSEREDRSSTQFTLSTDRSSDVFEVFEDCFQAVSHQAAEADSSFLHGSEDCHMSPLMSSSRLQHDEPVFPMSLPECSRSVFSTLTRDQHDGSSSSSSSTPSESFSFSPPLSPPGRTHCREPTVEAEAGTSYDTTITTPSPGPFTLGSQSKGKGRALDQSAHGPCALLLPSLDFEREEVTDEGEKAHSSKPKRVIGWDPESFFCDGSEPSTARGASIASLTQSDHIELENDRKTPTGSGLSRAFSQQRFEPPRVMQMVVPSEDSTNVSSPSPPWLPRIDAPPAPISSISRSRSTSLRDMSKHIKVKLQRSREFLRRSKHRDDIEVGTSPPAHTPPTATSPPSMETRSVQFSPELFSDESSIDKKLKLNPRGRPFTGSLPSVTRPSSPFPSIAGPVLTTDPPDICGLPLNSEETSAAEALSQPKDLFNIMLPVETRLHIFLCLVLSFVSDLSRLVEGKSWSVGIAAKMRWVGWEAGIRELVKISRVCRAWQFLALDGQLWSTLGASPGFPPDLLSRISQIAGPFVTSLQLEGIPTLGTSDLAIIAKNISTIAHPVQTFSSHGHPHGTISPSIHPVDGWQTNLTDVNLKGLTNLTTRGLIKFLTSCPILENLCLRGLDAVTNTTCIVIGDSNPRLRLLDLGRCPNMDAFGVTFICEAVERRKRSASCLGTGAIGMGQEGVLGDGTTLRELRISGLKRASEWVMASIAQAFPNLEVLDLSYCNGLSDRCVEKFVEWKEDTLVDARRGTYVQLTSMEAGLDPTDRTMYKRRVTKLRHLNLSHCLTLTDRACSALAFTVPNMELLELAGIGANLEDGGLVRLLKTLPYIRKLDLEDASHITDEVLTAITPSPSTTRPSAAIPIALYGDSMFISKPPGTVVIPQPGECLEELIISYAALPTPEAVHTLIQACPRLRKLDTDNTRITDESIRIFVEVARKRSIKDAGIVAIDCANISRAVVDELAGREEIRPRYGFRCWEVTSTGLGYADARDGDNLPIADGEGLDECDETKVVVKTFRSWQVVDKWLGEREKRNKARMGAEVSLLQRREGRSSRWFGRRSNSASGTTTPGMGVDDDDRGCIIM
ncbi:uncharacterized protein EI90DRAFT_223979 [Cantharellus anzutake]|uniref:uncharacterized protein n=1 Tax=Cantharellus anzutake TaxID=1750568 RepID=UPI00190862DE|nr:uncharacterized protein EI90DRAFT_223979 [Cantharellus anzutake]KAF8316703.1 hypothetical protein EI90DRAFT_223979 [Cantharellus anzutake]